MAIGDNYTGTVDVILKATDDGENSAEALFEVIVDPINDLPLVTLVNPARGETVTSGQVVLEWTAVDAETPAEDLTYNIYMGEGAAETLLAEGVTGTSFTAIVEDGRTYRWTVSGGDGTGFGDKARERVFSVDFESGPRTTLVAPLDGAVVPSDSAQLTWSLEERPTGNGGTVTYDVFMALRGNTLELAATGVTGTSWVATGLQNGKTYEWNVIPWDSLGRGTCVSGMWSLSVDTGFSGYGVDLAAAPTALTMAPGTSGALTLTLTNPGGADDQYRVSAGLPEIPGTQIAFTGVEAESIPLAMGEQVQATLTLLVPGSTASGTYTLTATALSLMGGMESNVSVTVNIVSLDDIPPDTGDLDTGGSDDKGGLFGSGNEASTLALILIIVVVLMAVLMMFVSYMYRKKSDRVSELEGRRRLEPASMVDAELAFSPEGKGLGGVAAGVPSAQQLPTGGAAAAATGGPVPLALPKVATGGSSPAGGSDAAKDVSGLSTPTGPATAPGPARAPGPAPAPGTPKPGPAAPSPAAGPSPAPSSSGASPKPGPGPAAVGRTDAGPTVSPKAPSPRTGPAPPPSPGATADKGEGPAGAKPKPPSPGKRKAPGKPGAKGPSIGTLPDEG
jgi:preprotein translocase subunit SecG